MFLKKLTIKLPAVPLIDKYTRGMKMHAQEQLYRNLPRCDSYNVKRKKKVKKISQVLTKERTQRRTLLARHSSHSKWNVTECGGVGL